MANIEIDGKKVEAEAGLMIIEVADKIGVEIPRFCYHDCLSIAANCRMCLVEIDKSRKPVPACATPITDGMQIFTKSAMARDAQRSVMEFLLVNHPLDCPICDQGGECELQDVSLSYGADTSRFAEGKRAVDDENLGSLVATEMTRCIACTRCVRFGEEIAGLRELGATGRGEHVEIETYVGKSLVSELSGNIIDLCPVGALTSRPYRFTARAWELTQHKALAPHDCVGSNTYLHARRQEIMRVVPRQNGTLNEVWLSDRDRFSYVALQSSERALVPKIKRHGQWAEVSWEDALTHVSSALSALLAETGAPQIGALISPSSTTEECYLWQKMWRQFGVQNIDHRLKESHNAVQEFMPLYPGLTCTIADLEQQESFLLIGSYTRKEQPLLNHRIRKAQVQINAKVFVLNAINYDFNFDVAERIIALPDHWLSQLTGILSAVLQQVPEADARIKELLSDPAQQWTSRIPQSKDEVHHRIATSLLNHTQKTILLGTQALHAKQFSHLWCVAQLLARLTGANIGVLTDGANAAGAWLAGAIPHRLAAGVSNPESGLTAAEQFDEPRRAYFLYQCEPEFDAAHPAKAISALNKADFVVNFTTFESEQMLEYSDVILPVCSYAETAGSYINVAGLQQSFTPAILPKAESKPGWEVLRMLAHTAHLDGFSYDSIADVQFEIDQLLPKPLSLSLDTITNFDLALLPAESAEALPQGYMKIVPLAEWPSYRIDNYVRRAEPLQCAGSHDPCVLKMHPNTAQQFNLKPGRDVVLEQQGIRLRLPLVLDDRMLENTFWLPMGYTQTISVWDMHAPFFIVEETSHAG